MEGEEAERLARTPVLTDAKESAPRGESALVNESELGRQDDGHAAGRAATAVRVKGGGGRGHRAGREEIAPDLHGLRVPMGLLQEHRRAREQGGSERSFFRVDILGFLVLEPTNVPAEKRAHAGGRTRAELVNELPECGRPEKLFIGSGGRRGREM